MSIVISDVSYLSSSSSSSGYHEILESFAEGSVVFHGRLGSYETGDTNLFRLFLSIVEVFILREFIAYDELDIDIPDTGDILKISLRGKFMILSVDANASSFGLDKDVTDSDVTEMVEFLSAAIERRSLSPYEQLILSSNPIIRLILCRS